MTYVLLYMVSLLSCHFIFINHQTTFVYKYQLHSNENTKTHFKYIPKKTQQPPSIKCIQNTTTYLYAYIINSVYRCISPLLFKDLHLSLAWNCKVLLGRLVLHYTMRHILDATSLLFYMEFGYQSLSLLYSKRSL